MTVTARGSFDIHLVPGAPEVDGAVNRFDFTKTYTGDLEGTGAGLMLAVGDPQNGSAGYVAMETAHGRLRDREGGFALQQFATLEAGTQSLHYEVVPGSGEGGLTGITGRLHLTIDHDGAHHYELEYNL